MKRNQKGYIMNGTTLLLLIPLSIIGATIINQNNSITQTTVQAIHSETTKYQIKDIKQNIALKIKETLNETANNVIMTKTPLNNATALLKNELNRKLNERYADETTEIRINNIESNPQNPFQIKVQYTLKIEKEEITQEEEIIEYINIDQLPDPVPHIQTKLYGTLKHDYHTIYYESNLHRYLQDKNINNSEVYENAKSPYYITKCPYSPYTQHKNKNILKNCLENQHYHESNDGACYLCRLEGKSNCPHYGLEVFIQTSPQELNNTIYSASSSDHVIFSDNTYLGENKTYQKYLNKDYFILLDNAHSQKYGILEIEAQNHRTTEITNNSTQYNQEYGTINNANEYT